MLAGWNGLMIEALAFAGRVLDEPRWVAAAAEAADFVLGHLVVDGRLRRGWLAGPSATLGFLDDHAFLAAGLLELFTATSDPRWLTSAVGLAEAMERHFGDPERGGWFQTADDHERLLVREKPAHDGAEPAGGSVAVQALLRLSAITGDERWRDAGRAGAAARRAGAGGGADGALGAAAWPGVGARSATRGGAHLAGRCGDPGRPCSPCCGGCPSPGRRSSADRPRGWPRPPRWPPWREGREPIGGRATAFVCERRTCRLPVFDPDALDRQLTVRRGSSDPGGGYDGPNLPASHG